MREPRPTAWGARRGGPGIHRNRGSLCPTERLLDPLADDLADAVTRVTSRTAVDRAATAPGIVGGDMGRDLALATFSHEIGGVVGFIGTDATAAGVHRVALTGKCDPEPGPARPA